MCFLKFDNYDDININKLMDLYAESNRMNAKEFYASEDEINALKKVEDNFKLFLKEQFFKKKEASYYVIEDNNEYVCACRINKNKNGYLIEALETINSKRQKGLARRIYEKVLHSYPEGTIFVANVLKSNIPSIKTHENIGFVREYEDKNMIHFIKQI